MLSVKPGATGSFYILSLVSGSFFYYSQWDPTCVFFLTICSNLLFFSFFFFLWQDTARFWQPGECNGTQTGTLCSSVCVRCVSVHGSASALCAVPPSSLPSLWCGLSRDAVWVCVKVQDDCVCWSWQMPSLSVCVCVCVCVPPHVHSVSSLYRLVLILH